MTAFSALDIGLSHAAEDRCVLSTPHPPHHPLSPLPSSHPKESRRYRLEWIEEPREPTGLTKLRGVVTGSILVSEREVEQTEAGFPRRRGLGDHRMGDIGVATCGFGE